MTRALVLAAACLPVMSAIAADAATAADSLRFVACPIYRDADAGAKSGCWLATDPATGLQWDVSQSPYKPDWNFAVLVEGSVAETAEQPCGAPVLNPVRSSRLAIDCIRHMLPAEGYPGRRFTLPLRNLRPLTDPPAPPPGPYSERTFTLFYELDRSFIVYQYSDYLLEQAAQWIRATNPRRLVVTGFAANEPETVSGFIIAERPEVAQERADTLALSLSRLFPNIPIETRAVISSQVVDHADADGIPGQSQRRAEITVQF